MSHLVCACAALDAARAAATGARAMSVFLIMIFPGVRTRGMLAQFLQHEPRQGEARGEAGRLDAEEIHQDGVAVLARAMDLQVGRGVLRARGLRPDAGVAGSERPVGKRGPVAADRGVEAL